MSALAAPSPWYCMALRRASEWLARAAQRLEAIGHPALPREGTGAAREFVHRCGAAEERLRDMRTRYY